MTTLLNINRQTCICCGHCVKVCPSRIFAQESPKSEVTIHKLKNCIACGHCVGVCPTGAVVNSYFPEGTVHKIERGKMPAPEQVMLLCKARRSNRAFSDKPVPPEFLDQILEAAHRAPTETNMQNVAFVLVTDPEKLKLITSITVDTYAGTVKKLENPELKPGLKAVMPKSYDYLPKLKRVIKELESGNDIVLRGAKAVIFIHTPRENRMGAADANLAYQNGSLMAESLGVSQFYTGFVCNALGLDKKERIKKAFGLEGRSIEAGMALGMPQFKFQNYIDRKEIKVTRL